MSWFASASDPNAPKFAPVQLAFDQEALFGPLVPQDTEWICAGGFVTETQTFYATTPTGALVMCQVIHSSVGVWYPSIQFTFRYFDPSTGKHIFKSTSVTNFVTGPSDKLDKRSVKSDQFTITLDPSTPNKYTIEGKYDDEVQVSLVFEALTPGWKLGAGPRGGYTYFGDLKAATGKEGPGPDNTGGSDGYAIHRFWPRCATSGIMRIGTDLVDLVNSRGTFIHAIQGLRPNVLAAKWNFANFQSSVEGGQGVALTLMEFTTTPAYGSKKVNIGSVVVGDKLVAITAGGDGIVGTGSEAIHLNPIKDVETGYEAPGAIEYVWDGFTLGEGGKAVGNGEKTKVKLLMDLLTSGPGEDYKSKGLIEKVDVLGHIPYLVKKFVNYAAGTKPYIYTWLNPAKATIETGGETLTVEGHVFSESTYIS